MDRHSNKSTLAPPNPREWERLAERSRTSNLRSVPIEPARAPVKSIRCRLSPHEIDDLVARYTAGASLRSLSLGYGVSRSGIRPLLRAEGLTLRVQGMTPDEAESAVRFFESGLTIRQIVEQIGYSCGTIRTMLYENGVVLRPSPVGKRGTSE